MGETIDIKDYPFELVDGKIVLKEGETMHKFIKVTPNETPSVDVVEVAEVSYEFLREQIGGLIEYVQFQLDGEYFDIILHEEGKLEGFPASLVMVHEEKPFDFIAGGFLIAKSNEDGDTVGLSDEEIEKIKAEIDASKKSIFVPKLGGFLPYLEF